MSGAALVLCGDPQIHAAYSRIRTESHQWHDFGSQTDGAMAETAKSASTWMSS
jgi:hypothetical protein